MHDPSEKLEHILLLRPGALGDALLTFPVLRELKQRGSFLTFVSNLAVLPLATSFGLVDQAYDYGAVVWSELFAQATIRSPWLQELLDSTDRAICWLRDPEDIVRHRLGEQGIQDIHIAPGRPIEPFDGHIVTYLAQTAGITRFGQAYTQAFSPGPHTSARFVAVHPGSGGAEKCWPVDRFAELIRFLWLQEIPVLLLAGPADRTRLAQLLQILGSHSWQAKSHHERETKSHRERETARVSPTPLTTLLDAPLVEVAERLRDCRCYVGNDSGITHLAAMLGLPTVALFGPSSATLWQPLGPHVTVVAEVRMQDIRVERVIEAITASLDRHIPC